MIVGVNDFSDLENQVQANTIYNGDITGDEVSVLTTAKRADGTLFQTNITPAGFGVINDIDVLFVVDATKINGLLPLEITSTSSQLALRYDALDFAEFEVDSTGLLELKTQNGFTYLNEDTHAFFTIKSTHASGDSGFFLDNVNGRRYSFFADISQDEDFRIFSYENSSDVLKYDVSASQTQFPTTGGVSITNNLGVGTASPSARIECRSTTEQLRLSYDASNSAIFTVTSSGYLKVLPSGGRVTIGEDVGSQNNNLNVMGSTGNTFTRIQDTAVNGSAGFILENDAQRWTFKVAGNSSDKFSIRDATGGIDKVNIGIGATGDISFVNFGSLGIGTVTPHASAILDVVSTTQGFLPPRMTTAQRDDITSPAAGLVIYNTTTAKLNVYTTAWEQVTSV